MSSNITLTETITLPDGSKVRIRKSGKTRKQAKERLEEEKKAYLLGLKSINGNTPAMKYARDWLRTTKLEGKKKVSQPVYQNYLSRLENHFAPVFDGLSLAEIKPSHCEQVLNQIKGGSQSDINKTYTLLSSMFASALADDAIAKNPMLKVTRPQGTKGQRRSLTDQERQQFFSALEDSFPLGLPFAITLGAGLRPGEVRALTLPNIRMDQGSITVAQAVKKGGQEIGPTKTQAGFRTTILPDWLADYLRLYLDQHHDRTSLLLFPSRDPALPFGETAIRKRWERFAALAGLPDDVTPYTLRHTFATDMAEAGVDVKTLQHMMGHEDVKMTMGVYTHFTENMLRQAAEKVKNIGEKSCQKVVTNSPK